MLKIIDYWSNKDKSLVKYIFPWMEKVGREYGVYPDSLRHTSMKTTESYFDSFKKSVKKKYSLKLVAFKDQRSLSDSVHES